MKTIKFFMFMALAIVLPLMLTSCSDDDDDYASKEHDTSICSEWIENSSNRYIFDYYRFYKDGTGIHGSYESDIDWIDEDDDITWYTEDNKYLYIDGAKYEYWCDGSSLELTRNGKTKYYYEK